MSAACLHGTATVSARTGNNVCALFVFQEEVHTAKQDDDDFAACIAFSIQILKLVAAAAVATDLFCCQ
jgi:hypothetical protein